MLNNITGILSTMFSMSIPLILAALGGVRKEMGYAE